MLQGIGGGERGEGRPKAAGPLDGSDKKRGMAIQGDWMVVRRGEEGDVRGRRGTPRRSGRGRGSSGCGESVGGRGRTLGYNKGD